MTAAMPERPTILVVDDAPAHLVLFGNLLKEHYHIKVANNGTKAIELATRAPPDMVLLDIMMPGVDGYEVCRRLRAHEATRAVPVIFLTAKIETEDEERGFMAGAVDFIHKPISPPIVLARVKTHLQVRAWQKFLQGQNAWLKEEVERRLFEVSRLDERAQQLQERSEQLAIAREALDRANQEMSREIQRRKLLEEELRKLATTDFLTGLFLRRHFFELGEKEINRARRSGAHLSLLVLDIDHFKSINDTYGHQTGDEVLTGFASIFRDCLRDTDILCRFGGEEFVAILPDTDTKVALDAAERLRKRVAASSYLSGGKELKCTVSTGLTGLRSGDTSIAELIHRADEALYHAKNSGRNRISVAPEACALP